MSKVSNKKILWIYLLFLTVASSLVFFVGPQFANWVEEIKLGSESLNKDPLQRLPVQDAGRIKPYQTFARESLQLIYGKRKYKDGKPATEVVLTWLLVPELWDKERIIQVRHSGLREALKLAGDKQVYHSPAELINNDRVGLLVQELRTKQKAQEKLDPYFQAVQTLENQLSMFHAIRQGQFPRVVPSAETDTWLAPSEVEGEWGERLAKISAAFAGSLVSEKGGATPVEISAGRKKLHAAISDFIAAGEREFPNKYPDMKKINVEVHHNSVHPFMWSWIFYLLAVIFLGAAWVGDKNRYYLPGWIFVTLGFLLQVYGMGMRTYLMGRPPVTNMYETVIWVPWITVLTAMVLELLNRKKIQLLAASFTAVFCLILSDLAPTVLDDTLTPLEPVLRDNFWLLTHVLMIVSSYGAFFLAFAVGDVLLFYYLRDEKKHARQISDGVHAMYRSIQVGVILLAGGTILGGVWADYSWGRFWGWDPKETWALIALLGYLAVLHGRLVGWVKSFGLAYLSVITFSLVIMAWYGVNFVLGAGLHSYGFGAGGVEYVSAFVAIHILWASFVATVRYSRNKKKS